MFRVLAALVAVLCLAASPALALTAETRAATLDRLAELVEKNYVFKDKAITIASQLRTWKTDPEIAKASDEKLLARLLSDRLRPYDRHFVVNWNPQKPQTSAPASPSVDAVSDYMRRANYGFEKVALLPGNIGYIRFRFFADFDTQLTGTKTPDARKAGEAALDFVQNSDAVIFDLRQNGGGSPAMVDLLLSAFFDKQVLLNRFLRRHGDKDTTETFTTLANYTGIRRPAVPLYVLVSGGTVSAAEEFAYDVQTQKRGLIVGEKTYGGANPGQDFDAGGGFSVFISTGAAINPITGTNWEGVGVQPDVAVNSSDALSCAHSDALRKILASVKPGPQETQLRWTLEQVEAEAKPPATGPLTDFVGLYGERAIALKDGALFYSRTRTPAQKLIPLAADKFGIDEAPGTRLTFKRDASGRVDGVIVSDGGGQLYMRSAK